MKIIIIMKPVETNEFFDLWIQIMTVGATISFIVALFVYLFHKIKLASIGNYKDKYDYLNQKEITYYKASIISLALGTGMLINTYGKAVETFDTLWFFVLAFISVAGATLVGYVGTLILQYYYPSVLNIKLNKWRYMPRVNPKTGNKMRLLSEDEEDVHLDEGMQAEENVFSVDYDVWIDEATGDTKIEKYGGHLGALQCNNCGFHTMKLEREEIIKKPTELEEGELIKHYECQFCKAVRATSFHVAADEESHYAHLNPEEIHFKKNAAVQMVKLEILSLGKKSHYEFDSVDQAERFLTEFDVDLVSQ